MQHFLNFKIARAAVVAEHTQSATLASAALAIAGGKRHYLLFEYPRCCKA